MTFPVDKGNALFSVNFCLLGNETSGKVGDAILKLLLNNNYAINIYFYIFIRFFVCVLPKVNFRTKYFKFCNNLVMLTKAYLFYNNKSENCIRSKRKCFSGKFGFRPFSQIKAHGNYWVIPHI